MAKDKLFEIEYNAEKLRRSKIRKDLRILKKESSRICDCCGYDNGRKLSKIIDPYHEEYGSIIYRRMCSDCYESAQGDI